MGSCCNSQGFSVPICRKEVPSSKYVPALSVMFILAEILYTEVLDPLSGSFVYSCYVFAAVIRLEQ